MSYLDICNNPKFRNSSLVVKATTKAPKWTISIEEYKALVNVKSLSIALSENGNLMIGDDEYILGPVHSNFTPLTSVKNLCIGVHYDEDDIKVYTLRRKTWGNTNFVFPYLKEIILFLYIIHFSSSQCLLVRLES